MPEPWPLSVAGVAVWPLRIPLKVPLHLASETITHAETLLIEVRDAQGRSGWGEASAAPTMTGEVLPGMAEVARRYLAPALMGGALADIAAIAPRLARAIRGNTGAKAAAEMAVLDLAARRAGLPLSAVLGVPLRDSVPAIAMIGGATDAIVLDAALAAQARGFRHIKVKLGLRADPLDDAALVRHLRAALGPDAHLSGDANMAWGVEAALAFLAALPEGTLDYLEQPLADDDLAGLAKVVAGTSCPICIDEGLHGLRDIPAHRGLAAGFGLKAIKLGGLLPTLAADALVRDCGMRSTLACKIAETSVGAAAAAHLAALLPDVGWGVSVTHGMLTDDVTDSGVVLREGQVLLPAGPGLGVVPDAARLVQFRG
ncbi:MAG: mandelate racemase/muconate lactonizing protein [Rubritepida sp.]|nr:mandelate racemase/muconate lactonizing protein [Rubritepida sp.]